MPQIAADCRGTPWALDFPNTLVDTRKITDLSTAVAVVVFGCLSIMSGDRSPGSVLWSADMETGDLSQWSSPDAPAGPNAGGGVFNSGAATAGVGTIAHGGRLSARLSITTAHNDSSGARLFRWSESHRYPQLYYSVWYYFPRRYRPARTPAWWNLFQWKSRHPQGNDPFFILNVGNRPDGAMYFYLYDHNTKTSYDQQSATIPEKSWTRVEAFYSCAADKTGQAIFWQDGVKIFDIRGVQTRYPDGDCQWSVNNYSNGLTPSPADIYVDDAAICLQSRCP